MRNNDELAISEDKHYDKVKENKYVKTEEDWIWYKILNKSGD